MASDATFFNMNKTITWFYENYYNTPENSTGSLFDEWQRCEKIGGIISPILILLISGIGLFANSVVIFIIVALKEYMKSVTNIYVLQLAIADFLFLFTLPFHARTMFIGKWEYGTAWCKIVECVKMINYYASIMFLTVMSVDRFLAINFAMNQKAMTFRSRKAAVLVSVTTWLLSWMCVINIAMYAEADKCTCAINFPTGDIEDDYDDYSGDNMSAKDIHSLMDDFSECSFSGYTTYFTSWLISNFVLAFIVPLLVICLCYAMILRRIIKPMTVGSKSQQSNRTRKRVTHVVTALVSVFVVCWLPYHAFNMARINNINLPMKECTTIANFTLILAYANSALNPFFYTFLGTNFKRRWEMAMGKASRGLRQSILSHSGDYTPGASAKRSHSRRKSSGTGQKADDLSSSFVTKHTIVPTNALIHDEKV